MAEPRFSLFVKLPDGSRCVEAAADDTVGAVCNRALDRSSCYLLHIEQCQLLTAGGDSGRPPAAAGHVAGGGRAGPAVVAGTAPQVSARLGCGPVCALFC